MKRLTIRNVRILVQKDPFQKGRDDKIEFKIMIGCSDGHVRSRIKVTDRSDLETDFDAVFDTAKESLLDFFKDDLRGYEEEL